MTADSHPGAEPTSSKRTSPCDPDGHMLEYLTMLDEPARPDAGIAPWSEWR